MIDLTFLLEILTIIAAAFVAWQQRKHIAISKNTQLLTGFIQQPTSKTKVAAELPQQTAATPINVKAELDKCASEGRPFSLDKYGKGARLNLNTGDITYE